MAKDEVLDQFSGPVNKDGRDAYVIDQPIAIKVGKGSLIFEIVLWCLAIIPGLVFWIMKIKAKNYLLKLQQKIQTSSSEIQISEEQRVQELSTAAAWANKAIGLDKDTMTSVAALRSGASNMNPNELAQKMDYVQSKINIAVEKYPDLKSHAEIADMMQKNTRTQREISAARSAYNDRVTQWNTEIVQWPTKKIVAAKLGLKTYIPYTASAAMREKSKEIFD